MQRPSNTTLALLAGVGLLLLILVYFANSRDEDQDKLGEATELGSVDADLNKACAGQATYDQIKRALFHQAAQVRGKDQPAYERIAAAASVRMENPAAEGQDSAKGTVDCAGSLAIDLPPGTQTVAGRRQLMTDIYYTVDGPKVVQLRNANGIINELAALTVDNEATVIPPPATMPAPEEIAPEAVGTLDDSAAVPPPPAAGASPSYDCSRARSESERSVCSDPGLAALDRSMAADYSRAMAGASPTQQALLRQTRDRFLAYRDNCPNSACIAGAYNDRKREIRDIMAGRWTPNR